MCSLERSLNLSSVHCTSNWWDCPGIPLASHLSYRIVRRDWIYIPTRRTHADAYLSKSESEWSISSYLSDWLTDHFQALKNKLKGLRKSCNSSSWPMYTFSHLTWSLLASQVRLRTDTAPQVQLGHTTLVGTAIPSVNQEFFGGTQSSKTWSIQ